jgi:amino acid transporter
MVAWVLVGVLSFIGALVLAEVAIIHPKAGGNYVFLRESYGQWAGFLWGWVEFWIIRAGSIAALATIFTESFHGILQFSLNEPGDRSDVLGFWALRGVTVTVVAVLAAVNMRGTLLGGGLQVVVTTVKVVSLLAIALLPFVFLAFVGDGRVSTDRIERVWPDDWSIFSWSGFGAAMVAALWSYHGWMNIAPVAAEVKEPQRNLPLAFLMGTLAVIVLYVSVNMAYYFVVSHNEMKTLGKETPVATLFSEHLLGSAGLLLASLALMISVFGSLNGNLLVGPRLLYAMGQDGLAPKELSQLHANWGTPALAIALMAGWSVLLVCGMAVLVDVGVLEKSIFDGLTDYAMFGAVSFETLAVASIFVVRWQYPVDKVNLPYRCWGYPLLPILYVLVMGAVLVNMFKTQLTESLVAVGFISVGAILYYIVFGSRGPARVKEPAPEPVTSPVSPS